MSACKPSKTELIAIYRLEFYKKQKKWKLYSRDEKKTNKSFEKTHTLNTTYNVEDNLSFKETLDPLNVAFVESEHDKTSTCDKINQRNLKKHMLSLERQESVNIWPNKTKENNKIANKNVKTRQTEPKYVESNEVKCYNEKPNKNLAIYRLQELQKAASLIYCESKLYPVCYEQATDIWEDKHHSVDYEWKNQDSCGDIEQENQWAGTVYDARCMDQEVLPQGSEFIETEVIDKNYHDDMVHTEGWQQKAESPYNDLPDFPPGILDEDDWIDCSVDSIGEFMREADTVPHSTEVDLTLPSFNISDVSFTSLSRMSSQQLAQAARLHLRVMRRLLLESEHRQKLRRLLRRSSAFNSFEEYPTRDVGPTPPDDLLKNMVYKDEIIAGSHINRELDLGLMRGRGRGRLLDTPFKGFSGGRLL